MSEKFKLIPETHVFLMNGRDQVLLLRRFNTGYEDGKYSVIAGHIDGNEEVRAAAIREAWEEAGIDIRLSDVEVVGVMHRKSDGERVSFFLAASRVLSQKYLTILPPIHPVSQRCLRSPTWPGRLRSGALRDGRLDGRIQATYFRDRTLVARRRCQRRARAL